MPFNAKAMKPLENDPAWLSPVQVLGINALSRFRPTLYRTPFKPWEKVKRLAHIHWDVFTSPGDLSDMCYAQIEWQISPYSTLCIQAVLPCLQTGAIKIQSGDEDVLDQHIGYFQPWHVAPFWVHTPRNFEGLRQSVNLEMRQRSIENPSCRWHCVQTVDAEWNEHLASTDFRPLVFGTQNPFATLPFEEGLFEGSIAFIRQGGGDSAEVV